MPDAQTPPWEQAQADDTPPWLVDQRPPWLPTAAQLAQPVNQPSQYSSGLPASVPLSENPDWQFTAATRGGAPGILQDALAAANQKVIEPGAAWLMNKAVEGSNMTPLAPEDEPFKPGVSILPQEAFPMAKEQGFSAALTRALLGFTTPGSVLTLPLAAESKTAQQGFLAQAIISEPDAVGKLVTAQTPAEIRDAATELGVNTGMAYLMRHSLTEGEPVAPPGPTGQTTPSTPAPTPTPATPAAPDLAAQIQALENDPTVTGKKLAGLDPKTGLPTYQPIATDNAKIAQLANLKALQAQGAMEPSGPATPAPTPPSAATETPPLEQPDNKKAPVASKLPPGYEQTADGYFGPTAESVGEDEPPAKVAPVLTPDGKVDLVATQIAQMKADAGQTQAPTIAQRAAAAPDKPVTMGDLAAMADEIKQAMTGNQIKPPEEAATPPEGAPVAPSENKPLPAAPEGATVAAAAPVTDTVGTAPPGTQAQTGAPLAAKPSPAITAEAGENPVRSAAPLSKGLTDADGDLFKLTSEFGKIPAFLPDGIVKAQFQRLSNKLKQGGVLSEKERTQYAKLKQIFPDNYEDNYGVGGQKFRAAYDAAKKAGITNEVFKRTNKAGAGALDDHLDFMRQLRGENFGPNDLWDMVTKYSNAFAERESGREATKEGKQVDTMQQQDEDFKRTNSRPGNGTVKVPVESLAQGDYFKLDGTRMRVDGIEHDDTGAVTSVTLEDGSRFGTQRIERDANGNISLRMDEGSIVKGDTQHAAGDYLREEPERPTPLDARTQQGVSSQREAEAAKAQSNLPPQAAARPGAGREQPGRQAGQAPTDLASALLADADAVLSGINKARKSSPWEGLTIGNNPTGGKPAANARGNLAYLDQYRQTLLNAAEAVRSDEPNGLQNIVDEHNREQARYDKQYPVSKNKLNGPLQVAWERRLQGSGDAIQQIAARLDEHQSRKADPQGQFKFATGDFFDQPESAADQNTREKNEKSAAAAREAKAQMLEQAKAKLAGASLDSNAELFGGREGATTRQDKSGQGSLFAGGERRGLETQPVTDAITKFLGTDKLPDGIRVVRDETAPWGARIEGRNKIVVNAAQISTPERAAQVILEEGFHGVWHDPAVQGAWQAIRDLVTPDEMRTEFQKRQAQGLPTDPATIREEAAIARLIKADANRGVFSRLYDVVRNVIKRTLGVDLPASARGKLKDAAMEFLRNRDNWQGARGDVSARAASGDQGKSTLVDTPERLQAKLRAVDPVKITGEEVPKTGGIAAIVDWARTHLRQSADNAEIGQVQIDDRAIKNSLSHGMSRTKVAAVAALPDLVERGALVSRETGPQMDAYILGAPVEIGGNAKTAFMLVRRDAHTQRLYVHEVVENEKLQAPSRPGQGLHSGAPGVIRNVAQQIFGVNDGGDIHFASGGQPRPLADVKAEMDQADDALKAATVPKPGQSQADYKQGAAKAAARYRTLRDELAIHPDYVAEQILKQHQALSEANQILKPMGKTVSPDDFPNPAEVSAKLGEPAARRLEQLANQAVAAGAELSRTNRLAPKMVDRITSQMMDDGRLPKMAELSNQGAGRTLDKMTDWLRANKFDSPKGTLAERLALGRRFAETVSGMKDTVSKAMVRAQAAWRAGVETMKRPPLDDDYRAAKKSWIAYDQQTGVANYQYAKALTDKVPLAVRRKAMSVWLDADGDDGLLKFQRDAVPDEYQPIWDAAAKLTPDEKRIALQVKAEFAAKLDDALKTGLIKDGRQDYGVPQRWKTRPDVEQAPGPEGQGGRGNAGNPYATLDTRDPFFSLQRQTPSYFDGIMAKGVPENLDIAHLVTVYDEAFHKALGSRGWVGALQEARAQDGAPVVRISGKAAQGRIGEGTATFVDAKSAAKDAVTADGRPYRALDHPSLKDWKFVSKDSAGNPILSKGDMLIHPDYYNDVKNELETPKWTRKLMPGETRSMLEGGAYRALQLGSFLKASKFVGPFHVVTEALHASFHGVLPSVHDFQLDLQDPKQALLNRNMVLGFGRAREMFEDGLSSNHGVWAKVPGVGAALVRMNNFTFNEYIPRLKMKVGLAVLARNEARYAGKLNPEQIGELTGRQMDAAFGGQNWRLMGTSKNTIGVMRLAMVAPDFLISRAKVIGQAFKPYNQEQRVFLLAQAAGVYALARVLNATFSDNHDPHFEPKNWDSVVIGKRAYHARFIVSDAANLARDLLGLGSFDQHGIPFISGRMGYALKTGIEAVTGKDTFTGQDKDGLFSSDNPLLKAFSTVAKDTAEWMTPMALDGFIGGAKKGQTGLGQVAAATFGVQGTKQNATGDVWNLARKFNLNSSDPKAVNYQKNRDSSGGRPSAYRGLDNLLDAGATKQAQAAYDELKANGRTADQIAARYDRTVPFTGNQTRETQFFNSLTPQQKATYQQARAEQRQRLAAFNALRK
jgi:hypothetical protein